MDHDVVLVGATGFVGKLVAECTWRATRSGAAFPRRSPDVAQTSSPHFAAVWRVRLPRSPSRTPRTDPRFEAMLSKARVVLTTAGP